MNVTGSFVVVMGMRVGVAGGVIPVVVASVEGVRTSGKGIREPALIMG